MKYLTLITLALAAPALAELPLVPTGISLSWTAPIERENGDTITASEIAGYEVADSCDSALIPVEGTTLTLPVVLPFDCLYTVMTVDTDGLRSAPSDPITVKFNAPLPPEIHAITIN